MKFVQIEKKRRDLDDLIAPLKSYIKRFSRDVHGNKMLNISWNDIMKIETAGRWWLTGRAYHNTDNNDSEFSMVMNNGNRSTIITKQPNEHIFKLAQQFGMNTKLRQNIFIAIMDSQDYMEA
eukprot:UN23442